MTKLFTKLIVSFPLYNKEGFGIPLMSAPSLKVKLKDHRDQRIELESQKACDANLVCVCCFQFSCLPLSPILTFDLFSIILCRVFLG